jgi:hypothetical protein
MDIAKMRFNRRLLRSGMFLALLVLSGCGGRQATTAAPTAGDVRGGVPDLRGSRVMVFPVQRTQGVVGDVDPELRFALEGRGRGIGWIFPDELRGALERAPAIDVPLEGLAVSNFLMTEVTRIGDPLYGQLRRMSALVDGQLALIPVQARYGASEPGGASAVELTMVLLDVPTGRLFWFSVVRGSDGPATDFGTVASAVEEVADQVLWFMQ